jgi:NTP pyrophosphatase (non-canonical NTP hydrolase)
MKRKSAINDLLKVMAKLRSPGGCPWDLEQTHKSLRRHAIEEVYELIDAIETGDDHEMAEELGDLLLQVVFHCQLAGERGAIDPPSSTRFWKNQGQKRGRGLGELGKNQARRKARNQTRAVFRTRRNSKASACVTARGKIGEESAQGFCRRPPRK